MRFFGAKITRHRTLPFAGGIDSQAQAFFDRVIADGGVVPTGLVGVSATFKAIKAIYGVSDITSAISAFYDAHYLGYKLGTGTGTTLGQAANKLYSACGANGDVVQATLANQPLLLAHSGTNYGYLPGISGNNYTTPNNTNNQLTNNFSFEFKVQPLGLSGAQVFAAKDNGNPTQRQFQFRLLDNFLQLVIDHSNGTQIGYLSTVAISFSANTLFWVRCSRNATTGTIKFFTSSDGITYTQLGANVSGYIGTLSNPSQQIEVGSTAGVAALFTGRIFEGKIFKDDSFTTATQNFNSATYNAATSQTQWTSATGEVWTINTGTATTGYKNVLVDRTIVQSDGVNDNLTKTTVFSLTDRTNYLATNQFASAFQYLIDDATNNFSNAIVKVGTANTCGTYLSTVATRTDTTFSLNLNLLTSQMKTGFNQSIQVNNGTAATTSGLTASTFTGVKMFTRADEGNPSNATIRTLIITPSYDNSTVKTAMYNFIKTLNNNAF